MGLSEVELIQSLITVLSPFDSRLFWIAKRSSSFTSGVKLVKSSNVSDPGGDKQGTNADALISEGPSPRCWSIIMLTEMQETVRYMRIIYEAAGYIACVILENLR